MANLGFTNSKEFTQVVKAANGELKSVFSSPYVIVNLLNKAAKGDFSKISNCDGLTRENVAKVAKAVKSLHNNRYAFDTCILPKASNGILGEFIALSDYQKEYNNLLDGEIVCDNKGRELCLCGDIVGYFKPTSLTITSMFNAFAKVAKVEIRTNEKAAKQAEKERKQAAKQAEKLAKAKQAVSAIFGEYMCNFSDSQILEKYAIIKGTK